MRAQIPDDVDRECALFLGDIHTETQFAFSPVEAYNKNLTYRAGRCPVRLARHKDFTLRA